MRVSSKTKQATAFLISMIILFTSVIPGFANENEVSLKSSNDKKNYIVGLKSTENKELFLKDKKNQSKIKKTMKYENVVVVSLNPSEVESLKLDASVSYIEEDSEAKILSTGKATKVKDLRNDQQVPWGIHAIV